MVPQTGCPRRCKVTLVAFVWILNFFLRGCIITLLTFVWLFSTVFLKMVPQSACPNGCIVALHCIGWICLAFLHCVSSDGPSKNAPLNTCYHLFCNCNSLNHICSEQRLRSLIRCAFSEFVCTVFQTCIPDQNKWKVFLNAYEGCVLSMPSFFCMQ